MAETDAGVRAALAAIDQPLGKGAVHTVGHIHPAAAGTISREGWIHHEQQIAEHLAKHPDVPSVEAVKVALFTHDEMVQAMEDFGYTPGHPTGQPFEAHALVAYYRPEADG